MGKDWSRKFFVYYLEEVWRQGDGPTSPEVLGPPDPSVFYNLLIQSLSDVPSLDGWLALVDVIRYIIHCLIIHYGDNKTPKEQSRRS